MVGTLDDLSGQYGPFLAIIRDAVADRCRFADGVVDSEFAP